VRLSPAERERAEAAAKVNHQRLSEFLRDAIVTAADECLEDTGIDEIRVSWAGYQDPFRKA
jgi:uncharacterized protein (DUF1778 family)